MGNVSTHLFKVHSLSVAWGGGLRWRVMLESGVEQIIYITKVDKCLTDRHLLELRSKHALVYPNPV